MTQDQLLTVCVNICLNNRNEMFVKLLLYTCLQTFSTMSNWNQETIWSLIGHWSALERAGLNSPWKQQFREYWDAKTVFMELCEKTACSSNEVSAQKKRAGIALESRACENISVCCARRGRDDTVAILRTSIFCNTSSPSGTQMRDRPKTSQTTTRIHRIWFLGRKTYQSARKEGCDWRWDQC